MTNPLASLTKTVSELCARMPASAGPAALAKELQQLAPQLSFRETLTRGGWYRLGGIVDNNGKHVTKDLEAWASAELEKNGDDIEALIEEYADSGLRATHLNGKTHYLVASTGNGASDFIQIEIEELQEMLSHELFDGEGAHGTLDELLDPRLHSSRPITPLLLPFLVLRRITDVAEFLDRMRQQKPEPQPIHRFVEAWENSSAGMASEFANHWVISLHEHLDRYRNTIFYATPVAAVNGTPPKFEIGFGSQGLALQQALQRYDRQAGYPMAWFFNMITTKSVPHAVASVVVDDSQAGFDYLPERDLAVVKNWLYRPYGF